MTLPEKVGQMMQLSGLRDIELVVAEMHAGSLLHILNERIDQAMDAAAQTRLGIPLLIGEDGIHGHSFHSGATIFPSQLGMACTWNPDLLERAAGAAAAEMAATGMHWTFSPVLCLTRDLRWGRVNETFGEDPVLIGDLAVAFIRGYQGSGLDDPRGVLATAKHFAGYSETQGGRDASEADLSRRKLRSYFLPPFERAAKAGCMAFMTGYQSIEGVPSTCNRWLLTEVLKEEWGFRGIVVTDWNNAGRLVFEQKVCADARDAAVRAVRAGNDLIMETPEFFQGAQDAVRDGLLAESELDAVVRRILALKFRMGLFENPRRPDYARQREVIACEAHRRLNLEVAAQSIVLLRNNGILPLDPAAAKTVAVIGPNADDPVAQLGDWSLGSCQVPSPPGGHPRECTVTLLDGMRAGSPAGCRIIHARGCSIDNDDTSGIPEAVAVAREADVIVVAVGDNLNFTGEALSTATLELQGGQLALLDALAAMDKPLVVVLINGKPLVLPETIRNAAAIIEAFNPGMQGGHALAGILWGKINPSGHLPISFPLHVGQQPVFYSQVRGQHGSRYADLSQDPLFAFGEGLSYNSFEIRGILPSRETVAAGESLDVTVRIANTGTRDGAAVLQLYIEDELTSVTWVQQALCAHRRIELPASGECEAVLTVPPEAFSLVDADGHRIIEPGTFHLHAGLSSRATGRVSATVRVAP